MINRTVLHGQPPWADTRSSPKNREKLWNVPFLKIYIRSNWKHPCCEKFKAHKPTAVSQHVPHASLPRRGSLLVAGVGFQAFSICLHTYGNTFRFGLCAKLIYKFIAYMLFYSCFFIDNNPSFRRFDASIIWKKQCPVRKPPLCPSMGEIINCVSGAAGASMQKGVRRDRTSHQGPF